MFQQKQWFFKRRTQLYLGSKELKSNFAKFKGSIFAILFGLIIGSLIIAGTGNSFITYFKYVFFFAFSSYGFNNWDNTLVWWAVYIVAGLALVVSFKTGMFNIGVAGQMLASAAVIITIGVRYNLSQPLMLLFAFFAAILASMLVSGIIVLLKVLFNVHEVVSSILLNWAVWYFVKWIFTTSQDLYNQSQGSTNEVHSNMNLIVGGYKFIIPIIIAFVLVFLVWFLLKKTTAGYKFRTVGMNPFAADYAGISRKKYSVASFMISGALAGIMAFLYYVGFNPSLSFSTDTLPALGSDCISVALVGQINSFGVVGASILWAIIKSGGAIGSTGLNIPNSLGNIIFGVIIYSAAIAALLSRLQPIKFIIGYLNLAVRKNKRKQANSYLKNIIKKYIAINKIKRKYNQEIKELRRIVGQKEKSKSSDLIATKEKLADLVASRNDNVQLIHSEIYQNYKKFTNYYNKEYDKIWKLGVLNYHSQYFEEKKHIYGQNLNIYIRNKIAFEKKIYKNKLELKRTDNKLEFSQLVKKIQNEKQENKIIFQNKFLQLVSDEKQQVVALKNKLKLKKEKYLEKKLQNKNDFLLAKTKLKNDYLKLKSESSAQKLLNNKKIYLKQIKLLKQNYQSNKIKLKEGGEK